MNSRTSPSSLLIRNALLAEIARVAPKPRNHALPTTRDCSFVCYINDGRGDLKTCGSVIRICVAKGHHIFSCGAGKDYTHPLSLVDRALIMGLAILYERETGCPWSLTHRPTEAFSSCFEIGPLPSPQDKQLFMKAVTEMVQGGVTRFATDRAEETAVAERIRAPLEGFLGWHDFGSEDGSYNKNAHPEVGEGTATERSCEPGFQPGTPNARTPSPSPSKSIRPSSLEAFITPRNARTPSPSPSITPRKRRVPNTKTPPLSPSRSVQPSLSKARVVIPQSKTTTRVPAITKDTKPIKYTETKNRKHAASARSRNHQYIGTILVHDTDAEDGDVEEDVEPLEAKRAAKKSRVSTA